MSLHSRSSGRRRTDRRNLKERESILGLSGWLFADLLLGLAIVFLVVQQRGQDVEGKSKEKLLAENRVLESKNMELEKRLKNLSGGGLIADENEQLNVILKRGALARPSEFASVVDTAEVTIGKSKKSTSWNQLKKQGYRIGFILWYSRDLRDRESTWRRYGNETIRRFQSLGLVTEQQSEEIKKSNAFPHKTFGDNSLSRNDLKMTIFLVKVVQK